MHHENGEHGRGPALALEINGQQILRELTATEERKEMNFHEVCSRKRLQQEC